jgi:3-mercaptopyruvate sulfurtransferase SseA
VPALATADSTRSTLAAKVLIAQGYRRVRPLLGGLEAWDAAGYGVERLPGAGDPGDPQGAGTTLA